MRNLQIASLPLLVVLVGACSGGDSGGGGGRVAGGGGSGGNTGGSTGGTSSFGGNGPSTTDPSNPTATGSATAVNNPPTLIVDPQSAPFVADDTATSGLPADQIERLKAGGASCSTNILYPYENTMFPGALPSPPIMWDGGADAAYVHAVYSGLDTVDYQFAAGASNPGELRIPQDAWNEITRRTQNVPLLITLSVDNGGNVSTCRLVLNIAQGNMTGAIYYNTYNAPGVSTPGNGAVMRLTLGQLQSDIYIQYVAGPSVPVTGPCVSCHSLSFNGSTIVASTHSYTPLIQNFEVWAYAVTQSLQPAPGAQILNANFGALTPQGNKILAMGNPGCTGGADSFPRNPNNFPLVEGPDEARLADTTTGQVIANAAGLDPDVYMWMPQFSPNGDMVVFNYARPDGSGGTNRREVAIMDYDDATNTFSNLRVIASNLGPNPSLPYAPIGSGAGGIPASPTNGCVIGDANNPGDLNTVVGALPMGTCSGPCYPAYPFFTPDGKAVVFALISEPDFASAFPGRSKPALGELWYVDLDSKGAPIPLANINKTLVASEAQHEYYPTVFPVSIAGHFWVVFTSRRSFGHHFTGDPNGALAPEEDPFRKRLWMAALSPRDYTGEFPDLSGDPSFPGFYIEGQSESGNVRGFATLNPCKATGNDCTTGLDCCTGFCMIEPGEAVGMCTDEIPMCSKQGDKCTMDSDCCPPGLDQPSLSCIGGFCGFVAEPPPPPPPLQ